MAFVYLVTVWFQNYLTIVKNVIMDTFCLTIYAWQEIAQLLMVLLADYVWSNLNSKTIYAYHEIVINLTNNLSVRNAHKDTH